MARKQEATKIIPIKKLITKEKLINMLCRTQGLEKEIILYDPLKIRYLMELKKAQEDIASWDSSRLWYASKPTQEDIEWAYDTMERLAIKGDNYDSGLRKYREDNGELSPSF